MIRAVWIFAVFLMLAVSAKANDEYFPSVAQVRVSNYSYSIDHPWQKGSGGKSYGSAVIIEEDRLLTNAHVIDSSTRVEVRRAGDDRWYRATVEHVSEASDLAMLKVTDDAFFKGAKAALLSSEIQYGSDVVVVGFPIGGSTVSVAKGVLSRAEEVDYAYSYIYQPAYQIDAAVNSGNSGGAVFSEGKLIGLSFQASDEAENIGYAIPETVIEQFLKDSEDGVIHGVPQMPFLYLSILNNKMAEYLSVPEGIGVYVSEVVGREEYQCAKTGDVIVSVENMSVSSSGMVDSSKNDSISIDRVAARGQLGDRLSLGLIREGEPLSVECHLKFSWNNIWGSGGIQYDYRPVWMEIGGLVLVDMAEEVFMYLEQNEIEVHEKSVELRYGLQQGSVEDPIGGVYVANVLDHEINDGYDLNNLLLKTVNGEMVASVDAVNRIVSSSDEPWIVLEFYDGSIAVFERSKLASVNLELAAEYGF
jgi:S1-C subfamily serine protease